MYQTTHHVTPPLHNYGLLHFTLQHSRKNSDAVITSITLQSHNQSEYLTCNNTLTVINHASSCSASEGRHGFHDFLQSILGFRLRKWTQRLEGFLTICAAHLLWFLYDSWAGLQNLHKLEDNIIHHVINWNKNEFNLSFMYQYIFRPFEERYLLCRGTLSQGITVGRVFNCSKNKQVESLACRTHRPRWRPLPLPVLW